MPSAFFAKLFVCAKKESARVPASAAVPLYFYIAEPKSNFPAEPK
jgi:hypothetical protein